MKVLRRTMIIACFLLYALGSFFSASGDEATADVYVIKLHGEVNDAMTSYLERELEVAQENDQPAIIDIDTNGGLVTSAQDISNVLLNTQVHTTAFVSGKALSAGVLLTISCDNVAMKPSSYIGAAEVIPYSEKSLSAWKGMLSTAAVENGRPEDIILAMADSRFVIKEYSQDGELLTLSARQATEIGVSDALCDNTTEVIEYFELGKTFEIAPHSLSDKVASALTSTIALNLFFSLGFVFMIMELFTAGFGVAGVISIVCFALYFFGGFIAGTAQWWAIGLFILGAMALVIEIFVPGFGIFGFSGLVMCLLGLVFSANSLEEFTKLAGTAIILCAVVVVILILLKKFTKIKFYDKLANKEVQNVEDGYIINKYNDEIVGKGATTITELRPIGIVEIEGERMDAFSDEGFIAKGEQVEITGKKSSSVVVRKLRKS